MIESPFKISGDERRKLKKELSLLKSQVKNIWFYNDIDNVYGGGTDENHLNKFISDSEDAIRLIELLLSEPSNAIKRENKLKQLGI